MHDKPSADRASLAGLDLNLLLVLDALLSERHVTRAGRRLGLSQSATSHALARLRLHFDDPLLVRDRRTLVPTTRGETLREPLAEALGRLSAAIAQPVGFDPATAKKTFVIACADYGLFVILPPLIARLSELAPQVDLVTRDLGAQTPAEALSERGGCDLVIGPLPGSARRTARPIEGFDEATHLYRRHLFDERFVCLVRQGHPRVKKRLTLERFIELPHAFISPRGTPGGIVDDVLAERGLERRVAVMVQSFLVAPWLVAQSDLIITLAERLARSFSEMLPLQVLSPPVDIPGFAIHMMWHERRHHDPGQRWLRTELAEACRGR